MSCALMRSKQGHVMFIDLIDKINMSGLTVTLKRLN